jgi:hypothetical protein
MVGQMKKLETLKRRPLDIASHTKLEAAKQALALVSEIPDIVELIDNAEAIRAAAKAKHISAPGINAWTRFVVDAERKGAERIKAMQEAGELPKHGGNRKSNPKTRGLVLDDLVPSQRAAEWSALTNLSEDQLDAIERVANEEDRLLTRLELLKLAKAGKADDTQSKCEVVSIEDLATIAQARGIVAEIEEATQHKIQVDDDAKIGRADRGAWIEAWLWVADELARSDLDDECNGGTDDSEPLM